MRTNICIVTNACFPIGSAGSTLIRNLIDGFEFNGLRTFLIVQNSPSIQKSKAKYENVFYCTKSKMNIFSYYLRIIFLPSLYILKLRKEIDFIIHYNTYSYEIIFTLIIAKIFKIKILHYQVDYYDFNWYNKNSSSKFKALFKYINYFLRYQYINRLHDGMIVISNFLKDHYLSIGYPSEKIVVIPQAIKIQNKGKTSNFDNINNDFVLGVLGPLNEDNGITTVLKSVAILSDKNYKIKVKLIGGSNASIKYYKEKGNYFNIASNLVFIASVHPEDVFEILSSCNVLILARPDTVYNRAGFPTKLGEYLGSGKPVIVTSYGDISEYFEHKKHVLLIQSNNEVDLSDCVEFLMNNPKEMINIANGGYEWAIHNLEYRAVTNKLICFFEQLK